MEHKRILFKDIMQSALLFFDKENINACREICESLHISNLPSYDSKCYYTLSDNEFTENLITDEMKVFSDQKIFHSDAIVKFNKNKHDVCFVFDQKVLCGVVHICDYNKSPVLQSLQKDILELEKNLRSFLIIRGFSNNSMVSFFEGKLHDPINGNHWKSRLEFVKRNINEMKEYGEFQIFDLKDLLEFIKEKQLDFSLTSQDFKNITKIRNMAMHGKNPVSLDETGHLYSHESLVEFNKKLKSLSNFSIELNYHLRYDAKNMELIKADNLRKLDIIFSKRPGALQYFIN